MLNLELLAQPRFPPHGTFWTQVLVSGSLRVSGYAVGASLQRTCTKTTVTPLLDLCTADRKFAATVTPISSSASGQLISTVAPRILFDCDARLTILTPRTITVPSWRSTRELLPQVRRISSEASRFSRRLSS